MKRFYKLFSLALCAFLLPFAGHSQESCLTPTATITALPYNSPAHQLVGNNGYTLCGEGNDYNPNSICTSGTSANGEDALFVFTPKLGDECITITLKGTGNAIVGDQNLNGTASITIFDACPEVPAAKCFGQWVNNGTATQLVINNLVLEVGRPYYILVDGGTACYKYVLSIAKGTCATNPPPTGGPGTDCGNAIDITFPYENVPGTTRGMKADYAPGSGCIGAGNVGEDVVYHFNLPAKTCVRYNVADMTGTGGVYLSKGCPGTTTPCIKTYNVSYPILHGNVVEEMTLDPGDYYIVIKGNSNFKTLDFKLTVQIGNVDDNVQCQTCNDQENCSSCKNAGFEKMNLTGWQGAYGTYGTPAATAGFSGGTILDDPTTRHTVVTKGHYDRRIPDLAVVPPDGGDYAIRLGNDINGGQAEQMVYTVVVDSNNTNFIYRYAVVLEFPGDGSHDETNKPFFSIKMNVGGADIACAKYEVFPQEGLPGFKNGGPSPVGNRDDMLWKDWTTVNIPLINYIGQTAKITFTTKDCQPGAHFGMAYLDAGCEKLEILRDSNLLCNPDTVTLTAPAGFKTYKWSTGATTRSIDVYDKGVYKVTCTTVTNCVIELETEIKYEKPPHPNFTWKFDCKDSVVTFSDASTPEGNNQITSWTWSFGDGDSAFVKNPKHKYTQSGSYNVTLVLGSAAGCVGDTLITIPIDVYMPQGNPNCIDTIRLCEKEKLQLYADSIDQTKYEWKGPGGFSSNLVNPYKLNILPKDSGYYKLKITIKDCVIKNDSTYVIIEPLKKVYITPDTIICEGDTAKLYCGGGKTYLWSPPTGLTSTTSTNPKAGPAVTTVYSVTMFNDLCPDTTLDVEVRVLSGVVSMQMPDTLRACKGGSIPLQASTNGFDTFKWTGPGGYTSTTRLPTITNMSNAKSGYYRLDCSISTNTCLIGADSTWLDLYPDPTITIDPKPGVICINDSVQLTASGASTYTWTPTTGVSNPNIANPYFKPKVTTQYVATGTSIDGCKGTDTVMVIVNPLPVPQINDMYFCVGDTGYLKCNQAYDSLLWSTGATTDSIMLTVQDTITVTLYKLGCVGKDNMIAFFQDPGVWSLGPDTLLCKGTGYYTNINLPKVDSARWQDNITTLNRTIDTAGTYYVDIYSGTCMYTDTIIVLFDSVPAISIPDSIVCIGTSVTMDATHPRALTYQWNNGPSTPTYTVTGTDLYIVTLTSAKCTYVDSIVITVVDPPNPDLQDTMFICQGDSVTFSTPHTYDTYLWNTNATGPSVVAKTHGEYSIIVTLGPCTRYDTTFLNVQVPPVISIGPDLNYCENTTDTLYGPPGFDAYLWNTGATTQSIIPKSTGTYSLTVTDDLCIGRDTARVVIDTIPDFKLPNDTMICAGNTVTLTSPLTAPAYVWSTGETTKSIVVDSTGEYRLYIRNGTCFYEDTTVVTVIEPPAVDLGPDKVRCIGTGAQFGVLIEGASYLWNTGATTWQIEDTIPRNYSVEVTYKVCKVTDNANLIVDLMPEPDLGPDQLVCEGTVVNLFANTFGDTYIWNTPSGGNTASVVKEGYYTVEVRNGLCVNKDTMYLKVQPKHDVILPPDVTICSNEKYDIVPVTDCQSPIFYWSTGASTRTITVRETGQYLLYVTNGVCQAIDTINVTVVPLPNAEPQYMLLCPDDSARILLPEGYDYFYDATMEPFTETMIYPQVEYNLLMFDKNGCRWPTSIKAELDMDCDRDIFVPNSFTPNNDGANDIFKVEAFELKLVELLIFDRWGHVVFQTQDPAKGWDGRLKGEVCKTDVYEWKLIYEDVYHRRKIRIGHVNLLR